ncbi:unnamed protein product [Orchesella dallaii]|uniref:Uncharacterized protein n=1 Tax=Orchesella dallaii TaxID=48710 RepID=A0ABP1RQT2_9HEXA
MYFPLIFAVLLISGGSKGFELEYDYSDGSSRDDYRLKERTLLALPPQTQIVSNSLSLSKYWAMQFDEELGRGDTMTNDKKIELEDNMLRMAEILHFIPEGAAARQHADHIDYILNLNHANPHTHIVRDPYAYDSGMLELEGSSSPIANNELGGNDKKMELIGERVMLKPVAESDANAKASTPQKQTYPNVRALHPRFALHGI